MALRCAFFGHHDVWVPSSVLEPCVERLIEEHNVTTFLVGGYGNFDLSAAGAVRNLKAKYPEIELILVLAYLRKRLDLEDYDGSLYPEGLELVPQRFAITHRNRMMVDMADFVVVYVDRSWGGAAQAWKYA